jgi:hypothetical protein
MKTSRIVGSLTDAPAHRSALGTLGKRRVETLWFVHRGCSDVLDLESDDCTTNEITLFSTAVNRPTRNAGR